MMTSQAHISMHTFAAPVKGQKKKVCMHFRQVHLFGKWYCNGNTMPHS